MSTSKSLCEQAIPAIRLAEQLGEAMVATRGKPTEHDYEQAKLLIRETYDVGDDEARQMIGKFSVWLLLSQIHNLSEPIFTLAGAGWFIQYAELNGTKLRECAVVALV